MHPPNIATGDENHPAISSAIGTSAFETFTKAWPIILVIATGAVYAMGFARRRGFVRALGVDALTLTTGKEEYLLSGVTLLAPLAVLAMASIGLWAGLLLLFRKLPRKLQGRLSDLPRSLFFDQDLFLRKLPAAMLMVVGAAMNAVFNIALPQLHSIPMMEAPNVPIFSVDDFLAQNNDLALGWVYLIGLGIVVWLLTAAISASRSRPGWFKIVFVGWCSIAGSTFLVDWASLTGVAETIDEYAVVTGPAIQKIAGPNALCVRIASDEKELALLTITTNERRDWKSSGKTLMYLPTSDASWWVTSSTVSLYRTAFIKWLANRKI